MESTDGGTTAAASSILDGHPDRIAFTMQEVCAMTGYGLTWLREKRRQGRLAYVRFSGARNLILADDLARMFDKGHLRDGRDTLRHAFRGRPLLTCDQVAHALGVSARTIRRTCKAGREGRGMDPVQVAPGARLMVARDEVLRFLRVNRHPVRGEW